MPLVEPSTGVVPNIVDGVYNVECLSIVAEDIRDDRFGNNAKLKIQLAFAELTYEDVYEDEGDMPEGVHPTDVYVFTTRINRKWNELSTFFKWAIGFGLKANPEEPFDTDRLVGKKAQAQIGHDADKENGWPKIIAMIPTAGGKKAAEPVTGEVLTEAAALASWMDGIRAIGYTTKEIIDFCQERYDRKPNELSAEEKHIIARELTT